MLLRSITKHVKEQNWFAVALDFFIVVVGILIAFQITNWNEERVERQEERSLIQQLDAQFHGLEDILVQRIERAEGLVTSSAELIAIIRSEATPPDADVLKALLFDTRRYNAQLPAPTVFTDALQSGRIGNLSNDDLRRVLFDYEISKGWWATVSGAAPPQINANSKLSQALTLSADSTPEESFRSRVLDFDWQGVIAAERELVEIHKRQSLQAEAFRLELQTARKVLEAFQANQKGQ